MKKEIVNDGEKVKGMAGDEEVHGGARVGGNAVTYSQVNTLPDPIKPEGIVNGGDKIKGITGTEEVHGAAVVGGNGVSYG